jgi:hypothetical protein
MREQAKDLAGRGVALLILLAAAYILFKVVLGVVSALVWVAIVIVAVIAVLWALARLL